MHKDEWENESKSLKRKLLVAEEKSLPGTSFFQMASLKMMQATFERTLQTQLADCEPQTIIDIDRISTQLRNNHFVLVSGFKQSSYLKTTLSAIVKSYNKDRCVEVSDASQWDDVDPKYVSLVLFVHPFGKDKCHQEKAKRVIRLLDIIKETHKKKKNPIFADGVDVVMVTDQSVFKAFTAQYSHDLLENPICLLQTTNKSPFQDFKDKIFDELNNATAQDPTRKQNKRLLGSPMRTDYVLRDDKRSAAVGGKECFPIPNISDIYNLPNYALGQGLVDISPYSMAVHASVSAASVSAETAMAVHASVSAETVLDNVRRLRAEIVDTARSSLKTDYVLRDDQRLTVIGGQDIFSDKPSRIVPPENEFGLRLAARLSPPCQYIGIYNT